MDKLDLTETQNLYASKDTKKMQRQVIEWEEIFAKHIYDKRLVSKMYFKKSHNSCNLIARQTTQLKVDKKNQKIEWRLHQTSYIINGQ